MIIGISGLIIGDRPTIVLPPTSGGPIQGWGTKIG